ncbi:MAG: acetate kinase [Clostridia bacterium]|nr:acetate kinase [Clostridia bacterium]
MKILVINAGSSSLKYQLIDMENESVVAKGACERIAIEGSKLEHKVGDKCVVVEQYMPDHTAALQLVLNALTDKEHGAVKSVDEIGAVGHRILHSAEDFKGTVLVTDETIAICEKNTPLGPLHMPANIACVKACREILKGKPMGMVFDTAFHSTMPKKAYMYGVPYDAYTNWQVRKYGFHGTSHKYVSGEARKYLGRDDVKIVTCHLGNGSSLAAVKDGLCVDTSMGFTPSEGLVMGTRSGDIDPAVIEYIMDKSGMDIHQTLNYLNKKSGVLGISGVSSDFRDLAKAAGEGNERAALALDMFAYRVQKYIGAFAAAMGGLDCIVFTGGIGENDKKMRERIMNGLDFLGANFDKEKNENAPRGTIAELNDGGKVKILVIPTNEELVIARETLALL